MIRVIIVDDHQLFIDGVIAFLDDEDKISVVGTASNGKDAINLVRTARPDLVLLDVHLPETHGEELMNKMRENHPNVKILAVTMSDQPEDIQKMMNSGANGYLLKEKGREELINAIYQVHQGHRFLSFELAERLIREKEVIPKVHLTKRELEVLSLIKTGLTDQEIGERLGIVTATVVRHAKNMRRKTEARNRIELINYANEHRL